MCSNLSAFTPNGRLPVRHEIAMRLRGLAVGLSAIDAKDARQAVRPPAGYGAAPLRNSLAAAFTVAVMACGEVSLNDDVRRAS